MEKAKISRDAAEAIATMKYKGATLYEIVKGHSKDQLTMTNGWEDVAALDGDTLIRALYIGYEVEETPEDKVRELYKNKNPFHNGIGELSVAYRNGIYEALDALNIKIEGVNA